MAGFVNGAHTGKAFEEAKANSSTRAMLKKYTEEQVREAERKRNLAKVIVLLTTNSNMIGSCFFLGTRRRIATLPTLVRPIKRMLSAPCPSVGFSACTVGSVLYFGEAIDCHRGAVIAGTWLYIIGSIFFTVSGSLPMVSEALHLLDKGKSTTHGVTRVKVETTELLDIARVHPARYTESQ